MTRPQQPSRRHDPTGATVLRACASLIVLVVLLAGVPWGLIEIIGNPVPPGWSWEAPVSDRAVLGLVAIAVWVMWAQLVVCVSVEVAAEARIAGGHAGDWLARVPGTFGSQQALARTLVQAVVALGVASAALTTSTSAGTAHVDTLTTTSHHVHGPTSPPHERATATQPSAAPEPENIAIVTAVVARGDSLWSLAQQHLGTGERWRDIATANNGRVMADGLRFRSDGGLRPGWTLQIPTSAEDVPHETQVVTVEAGDSLWTLSEEAYGEGDQWPRLYNANRGQVQDPDLIYPGERLHVPTSQFHSPAPAPEAAADPRRRPRPPSAQYGDRPAPGAVAPGTGPSGSGGPARPETPATQSGQRSGQAAKQVDLALLARTLGGAGVLFSGALFAALMSRRRAQFRNRRPGNTITPTPPELAPVEAAIRRAGSAGADAASFLDGALRDLAERCHRTGRDLPDVAAARLTLDHLELVVPRPTPSPPTPWTADPLSGRWIVRHRDLTVDFSTRPSIKMAPYPTLVAVGLDEKQGTWLIDLEAAGTVQLTGDSDKCQDLMRFMAAELATNTWSDNVDVLLDKAGRDLVPLNPARLQTVDDVDLHDLAKTARRVREAEQTSGLDVLAGRLDGGGGDTWLPTVLIQLSEGFRARHPVSGLAELQEQLAASPTRSTVAYLALGRGQAPSGHTLLHVAETGTLTTPWAAELEGNGLTAPEAAALGELFGASDDEDATAGGSAMPSSQGDRPIDAVMDAAGAVRSPDSVRPGEAAAATAEIEGGAPVVGTDLREIRSFDPDLDADLAEWHSEDVRRPRLHLLGPVELQVAGDPPSEVHRRVAYYTEMTAYLALRPQGVTPAQMADAFDIQTNTLHTRINTLRKWLGQSDTTGQWRLPESLLTPASKARGVPVYQLQDVLVDADLFRRLRVRSQTDASGLVPVSDALDLVAGQPFAQLRPGGYGWLAAEPADHYLTAAILDLCGAVVERAEDPDLLNRAHQLTQLLNPDDEGA